MHRGGRGRGGGRLSAGRGDSSEIGTDSGAVDAAPWPGRFRRRSNGIWRLLHGGYLNDGGCSGFATSQRRPRKR